MLECNRAIGCWTCLAPLVLLHLFYLLHDLGFLPGHQLLLELAR